MGSCCMERVGSVSVCVCHGRQQVGRPDPAALCRLVALRAQPDLAAGSSGTSFLAAAVPASSQSSGRSPSQTAVVTRPLLLQHPLPPVFIFSPYISSQQKWSISDKHLTSSYIESPITIHCMCHWRSVSQMLYRVLYWMANHHEQPPRHRITICQSGWY